jgi:serine/threonine-protein kinase HipA
MEGLIEVHQAWGEAPERLGTLRVRKGRTGEIFDFTFDDRALADATLRKQQLDPDIGPFPGPQFPKNGRSGFGVFQDSSPDRWGETLIRRRFERDKRAGVISANARLGASDYLLGVHDPFRSGALRYKASPDGPFLDNRDASAAPPFVTLREFEAASRGIEEDTNNDNPAADAWIRVLLAPGASLGGARPKATVVDAENQLWIAKFPSVKDRRDVGAWEFVVQRLAARARLRVPRVEIRRFAHTEHTYLVRRFDRHQAQRIHFASAMTLTGHTDGDDASTGASYLEIAEVISSQGASPTEDLQELWSRIVFNVLVSNTDDHLRNHGFVLIPNTGWRLSAAYDMNAVPGSTGLALNIDERDNALDVDLVRSIAPYLRVKDRQAREIITRIVEAIRTWSEVADSIGIPQREQSEMRDAFLVGAST